MREVDAAVGDGHHQARVSGRDLPRRGHVHVDIPRAAEGLDCLADVVESPLLLKVSGRRGTRQLSSAIFGLDIQDIGPAPELCERLRYAAGRRGDHLGVRQRDRRYEFQAIGSSDASALSIRHAVAIAHDESAGGLRITRSALDLVPAVAHRMRSAPVELMIVRRCLVHRYGGREDQCGQEDRRESAQAPPGRRRTRLKQGSPADGSCAVRRVTAASVRVYGPESDRHKGPMVLLGLGWAEGPADATAGQDKCPRAAWGVGSGEKGGFF